MPWSERILRGNKVWALADEAGKLIVGADGRVDVKYKLDEGATVYRASERNLDGGSGPPVSAPPPAPPSGSVSRRPVPAPAPDSGAPAGSPIIIYTDGACSGNPGPMGVGAVVIRDGKRREIGEYLGVGTNNIAELTAVERAIDALDAADRERSILVHTDSAYSIGVLSKGFQAKKNVELIARMKAKLRLFPRLRFIKVDGHAGVPENERCDALARAAVARRASL